LVQKLIIAMQTIFFDLIELDSTSSNAIAEVIGKSLNIYFPESFLKDHLVSFTADGSSTILGRISGVVLKFKGRYLIWLFGIVTTTI